MAYQAGPFSGPHLYLQWGGDLPGGDQWSCGLRMKPVGASTSLDPSGMLAGVSAAVEDFHTHDTAFISPNAKLAFAKLNYIDPSGHYAEDTTFEHAFANIGGAGGWPVTPPNQVCLAVSLLTGFSRGPAHRGRFYMPLPTPPVGTDGRITEGARDGVKAAGTAFVTALNAVNANYDVAVFSRKLGSPASRLVTGVEVGRVLDTQRRRRNKLAEAY